MKSEQQNKIIAEYCGWAMKPEQQNKIIAEYCGWKKSTNCNWEGFWYRKGTRTYQQYCPDFCEDLNLMHEAEKHLHYSMLDSYYENLRDCYTPTWCAPASARAEAFLYTIEQWKDEP